MFDDYQTLVLQHYKKKRDNGDLPTRLKVPTNAQIRDQCLIEFNKGVLPKDRKILIDFFKESGDDNAIREKINNYKPEGFKALLNYLKGPSTSTSPKNTELLAWLINFEPRPFELGKKYILEELKTGDADLAEFQEGEQEEEIEELTEEDKKPKSEIEEAPPKGPTIIVIGQKDDTKQKSSSIAKPLIVTKPHGNPKFIMAALWTIIVTAASIIYLKSKDTGCMYWEGDHYQEIPCSQKVGPDTLVIALNMERLNTFKKITRPDTITYSSIGKIWYIKLDRDSIEYYTADGNYPLDPKRRMKPLTGYMIKEHINVNQQDTSH